MTITAIKSLEVDKKANLLVVVLDTIFSKYSGGDRARILVKDENGDTIECVGFNDVFNMCSKLCIGSTYILNDVLCSTFNETKQVKILSFTSIHTSSQEIKMSDLQLKDVMNMTPGEQINLKVIIDDAASETGTTASGGVSRRYKVTDPTESMMMMTFNVASETEFGPGSIVAFRGKIGTQQQINVFSPMSSTNDPALEDWWKSYGSDTRTKRLKPNYTLISDITFGKIGQKIDIAGIVLSSSIGTTQTQNGTAKKSIQVVDQSCRAIDTTIFGSMEEEFEIGSAVYFTATVSEWNNLSLTTNANMFRKDTIAVNSFPNLETWWSEAGKHATHVCVSTTNFTELKSIEDAYTCADEIRVNIKGKLSNGVLSDESAKTIPVIAHSTAGIDVSSMDGAVSIRNAHLSKDRTLIVFKSSLRMVEESKQPKIPDVFAGLVTPKE